MTFRLWQRCPGPNHVRVMIENSTFTNNNGAIKVKATAGGNTVLVENALIDSNKTFGIKIDGASTVFLSSSFTGGQPANLSTLNVGIITSCHYYVIRGGAPTNTTSFQRR